MFVTKIEATLSKVRVRVAVYCRVSTARAEQEESLDAQRAAYMGYIASNPDWVFAGLYADARSGLDARKREAFQQLIEDACRGRIDLILCKSVSRFSRNIVECQRYTDMLLSKNVAVVFEKERIRTDAPTSGLIFSLMCAIAQDESRSISENIRVANRHRVEAGLYTPHRNQMLGYDVRNGKLAANAEANAVRMIFEMYAGGASIAAICRSLNAQGIRRKRVDAPFQPSIVQKILRNESYVGDKRLQKLPPKNFITKRPDETLAHATNYLVDDHEPIVRREVWNRVQQRLSEEEKLRSAGVHRREGSHFLYGKLYCAACGAPYMRRTLTERRRGPSGDPVRYKVWKCARRLRGGPDKPCRNDSVREAVLLEKLCALLDCAPASLEQCVRNTVRIEIHRGLLSIQEPPDLNVRRPLNP